MLQVIKLFNEKLNDENVYFVLNIFLILYKYLKFHEEEYVLKHYERVVNIIYVYIFILIFHTYYNY